MNADWINVLVGLLNVAVTGWIAVALHRASSRVVAMEQDRAIKDAWITIDQVALADETDMQLLDAMFCPDDCADTPNEKRKRWLAYMVLNPLEAAWTSARQGKMPDAALGSTEESMRNLVRDEAIHELIQRVVYDTAFKARCMKMREEWERAQAERPPSIRTTSPVV